MEKKFLIPLCLIIVGIIIVIIVAIVSGKLEIPFFDKHIPNTEISATQNIGSYESNFGVTPETPSMDERESFWGTYYPAIPEKNRIVVSFDEISGEIKENSKGTMIIYINKSPNGNWVASEKKGIVIPFDEIPQKLKDKENGTIVIDIKKDQSGSDDWIAISDEFEYIAYNKTANNIGLILLAIAAVISLIINVFLIKTKGQNRR